MAHKWFLIVASCIAGLFLSTGSIENLGPRVALGVEDERIDLSGQWSARLDPAAEFSDPSDLEPASKGADVDSVVRLPGSLRENGLGDPPGPHTLWTGTIRQDEWNQPRYKPYRTPENFKIPFWLQPNRHYVGPAWFQRAFSLPEAWRDQRVVLHLERPHWETSVWVDGQPVTSDESLSLSTPHEYVLPPLEPGQHKLTIRVDNRMDDVNVGPDSHSVSDHTQSNWNGLVGRLELRATDQVWIERVDIYPDVAGRRAMVKVAIGNATGKPAHGTLRFQASSDNTGETHSLPTKKVAAKIPAEGITTVDVAYPLGDDMLTWDEFSPAVYQLDVQLQATTKHPGDASAEDAADAATFTDRRREPFGMREITTRGTQFVLNDRPIFLRGTLECCIFPLTGYPPTNVDYWRKIIRTCKAHGLNHIRFHSWCPPKAAFVAADELGFYYQVECSSWANSGASIGNGRPIDQWLYEEGHRITREYGNHPSFVLMAYGNEPSGPGRGAKFLGPWCEYWKKQDPRRLHTSGAGWPMIDQSEFHSTLSGVRIQAWGAGLRSIINGQPPRSDYDWSAFVKKHADKPTISHEIGQWCVYPNFDEIEKYTGVLKPKNFEIFRDLLEAKHMGDQARDFLMASGKLQTLCYKADIEAALRTKGFGGFQLLDLHDFPGQGTALVGVLDPFWDSKPYVSPEEFRRFCNTTVPLARMSKRTFSNSETFSASLEVAHFGAAPLPDARPVWKIVSESGQVMMSGTMEARTIAVGNGIRLGQVNADCSKLPAPAKYTLVAGLEGTPLENDWDFWVYPSPEETAAARSGEHDVTIVESLDDTALEVLNNGGKVLLLAEPRSVKSKVAIGFSSVFWNTAWTGGQPPHTLGILCDPKHPVFKEFPTEYHTNWQWWELIHNAATMEMDQLPAELRPLVQPIHTWFEPKRLGLLFEAEVQGGKLMVCSMDLRHDLETRHVARQLRHSILSYMRGDAFAPKIKLAGADVSRLFKAPPKPSAIEKLGATAKADSFAPGYEASKAIDGNPATCWHTAWEGTPAPMPHEITVDLRKSVDLKGLTVLPRQDMSNGRVARCEIYLSRDGRDWGEPVASAEWPDTGELQKVVFGSTKNAQYIKLVITKEVSGNPFAAIAEIDIQPE